MGVFAIAAHHWWLLPLAAFLFFLIWVARKLGITQQVEGKMFGGALKGPVPALLLTGAAVAVVAFVVLEIKESDKEPGAPSAYCRTTHVGKASGDIIEQRQPAKGTACVNESSTATFFDGQLSVSIGQVARGSLQNAKMSLHAEQPGLTNDSNCGGAQPFGSGHTFGVEVVNSPKQLSYTGEIHVVEVHRHSALVYATWHEYHAENGAKRTRTRCLLNGFDLDVLARQQARERARR
jgi:hypothetical protein